MNIVKPFGPSIGTASLSAELTAQLLEACVKSQNDLSKRVNQQLVGFIEQEFDIRDSITDTVLPAIQRKVADYLGNVESLYQSYGPFSKFDLKCVRSWCNVQQAGEHNPIHSHPYDDIVCVIFPKIDIDHEFNKYTTSANTPPGSLTFYNQSSNPLFGKDAFCVTPKTGDMYIFPGSLAHFTTPFFKEGDSRWSVSCNFVLTEHFYSLRKLRGYQ
jgi:hypothetical protein